MVTLAFIMLRYLQSLRGVHTFILVLVTKVAQYINQNTKALSGGLVGLGVEILTPIPNYATMMI
jgi:hypothetical protein